MTMDEWVKAHKGDLARIAVEKGVPVARFYEAAKRSVKTARHARALSAATDGVVSVASLLGLTAEEASVAGDTAPAGTFDPVVPTDEEKRAVAEAEADDDSHDGESGSTLTVAGVAR
jgi:hypothetical protein